MFAPGNPFQSRLLFVGKARSLSLSGASERSFASVGSRLTCKHYTILERLARDKHSAAGTGREKDKKNLLISDKHYSVERLGSCLTSKCTSERMVRRQFMSRHKSAMPTLSLCTCSLKVNNGRQNNSVVAEVWQALKNIHKQCCL